MADTTKILITGPTGNVGSAVLDHLQRYAMTLNPGTSSLPSRLIGYQDLCRLLLRLAI
jgi:uncharacterized protein YbjT (DUF2867 family)